MATPEGISMTGFEARASWKQSREVFITEAAGADKARMEAAKAKFLVKPEVNPFEQRTVGLFSSPGRAIKTIFLIPLAVVRFIGVITCFLLVSICGFLAGACSGRGKDYDINGPVQPLPFWSHVFLAPVPCIVRTLLFCMGFQWVSWTGRPAPKSEAPIMAPSHQSWAETFYLGAVRMPCGMAEIGNFNQPFAGAFLKLLQFVGVNREDATSRKAAAETMAKRCADPNSRVFMIFPEGVCTSGSHLVQFKDGVFRVGLPVQPVAIFYPYEKWCSGYHPKNPMEPKALIGHIGRCLFEFHNPMHVHWCPVYYPSEEEKKDARLYARNVRQFMAEQSGKQLTEHAFEDVRLALVASRQLEIKNPAWVQIETGKAFEQLHFNFDDAKTILERFERIDIDKTGEVNIDQFLSALELPRTKLTEQLFKLYDLTGDGTIEFREYMCAQAMFRGINDGTKREDERQVKGSPLHEGSLNFVWRILTGDAEGKTTIEYEDLKGIFDRYSLKPREGNSIRELFDKAKGDKAALDREAFDSMMLASPEYMQLFRLGEQQRSSDELGCRPCTASQGAQTLRRRGQDRL